MSAPATSPAGQGAALLARLDGIRVVLGDALDGVQRARAMLAEVEGELRERMAQSAGKGDVCDVVGGPGDGPPADQLPLAPQVDAEPLAEAAEGQPDGDVSAGLGADHLDSGADPPPATLEDTGDKVAADQGGAVGHAPDDGAPAAAWSSHSGWLEKPAPAAVAWTAPWIQVTNRIEVAAPAPPPEGAATTAEPPRLTFPRPMPDDHTGTWDGEAEAEGEPKEKPKRERPARPLPEGWAPKSATRIRLAALSIDVGPSSALLRRYRAAMEGQTRKVWGDKEFEAWAKEQHRRDQEAQGGAAP